eukprot:6168554-Prymnesium_polylepis.1
MVDDRSLVCHAIEHQVIVSGRMPAVQRGRQSGFASCSVHMHGAQAGSSVLEGRNCRLGCDDGCVDICDGRKSNVLLGQGAE